MKLKYFVAALALATFMTSCEDDTPSQNPNTTTSEVPVILHYDFKYGTTDFALNQEFTSDSGYTIRYTLATFYLAKPVIMDDAGNSTALNPEYYIIRPDVMMSNMGTIEAGHAHMFNVSIGVDAETNTETGGNGMQPTDFSDVNHPLAPQPEGMYWSWASGYIFVKIEGEIDYEGDGTYDQTFKYHLGTDPFRKDRSTMLHTSVEKGDTLDITMTVDYQQFLQGIDLHSEVLTMSMGDARPLAEKMMNQFDAATSFELGSDHGHKK
ncbi:MbnP family protein [Croceimicrobium sp.]|uniref:MbnP family protein n=1 Tax=Croceimicrobium sp. TaxID=2828340 RepID=UPI003BAD01A9